MPPVATHRRRLFAMRNAHGPQAYVTFDLLAAIGLTALMVLMFSKVMVQFSQAHEEADVRRMLRLAAELQLNRIRAGVDADRAETADQAQSDAAATADRLGAVRVHTNLTPGRDEWIGFDLARTTAEKALHGRIVRVELLSYVPAEGR